MGLEGKGMPGGKGSIRSTSLWSGDAEDEARKGQMDRVLKAKRK